MEGEGDFVFRDRDLNILDQHIGEFVDQPKGKNFLQIRLIDFVLDTHPANIIGTTFGSGLAPGPVPNSPNELVNRQDAGAAKGPFEVGNYRILPGFFGLGHEFRRDAGLVHLGLALLDLRVHQVRRRPSFEDRQLDKRFVVLQALGERSEVDQLGIVHDCLLYGDDGWVERHLGRFDLDLGGDDVSFIADGHDGLEDDGVGRVVIGDRHLGVLGDADVSIGDDVLDAFGLGFAEGFGFGTLLEGEHGEGVEEDTSDLEAVIRVDRLQHVGERRFDCLVELEGAEGRDAELVADGGGDGEVSLLHVVYSLSSCLRYLLYQVRVRLTQVFSLD